MIEIRRINRQLEAAVAEFFALIQQSQDDRYFHPHAFDGRTAAEIAGMKGKDAYYVILIDDKVMGYGMLRGWDQGYETPSLGIIIHPKARRMRLGRMFMEFLHSVARLSGAKQIRVKVYPNNIAALRLYQTSGYSFTSEESGQWVGFVNIL